VLDPLARDETESYVAHRLSIGRPATPVAFDAGALDGIQMASGGVPRLISLVCDRSLMAGAELDARLITIEMVRGAAASLGLRAAPPPPGRWRHLVPRWLNRAST
jgi:general secretion pathway protein A